MVSASYTCRASLLTSTHKLPLLNPTRTPPNPEHKQPNQGREHVRPRSYSCSRPTLPMKKKSHQKSKVQSRKLRRNLPKTQNCPIIRTAIHQSVNPAIQVLLVQAVAYGFDRHVRTACPVHELRHNKFLKISCIQELGKAIICFWRCNVCQTSGIMVKARANGDIIWAYVISQCPQGSGADREIVAKVAYKLWLVHAANHCSKMVNPT